MSSLRGEGQDAIPVDPTPTLAPTDTASTSSPSSPIGSVAAKPNIASAVDSDSPEASEAMDSTRIAEASGPSSAAPPAPAPSTAPSTSTSTSIPSNERPLPPTPTADVDSAPPTPTAPVTPAKLLSLPLRSALVSSSAGQGSSSSSSSVPAVPVLESTALSPSPATPPLAVTPSHASEPVSEHTLASTAARQSVAERVPTPAPAPVSSGARALPPPPPAEPESIPPVLPVSISPAPTPAAAPAPQPSRRVSIALPQNQSQNQAPLPPTPQQSGPQVTPPSRRLSQVEYIVPHWQPDREVLYCPICFVYFSLFNRKHHCRKCGRVVCNSCSPHRIVIPHAFIVQPPEVLAAREREQAAALAAGGANVHAQAGASTSASSTAFATRPSTAFPVSSALQADGVPVGGERVRLCNPCVPDPNTSPPTAPGGSRSAAHSRSRSGSSIAGTYNYISRRQGVDFSGAASGSSSSSGDRRYTVSNAQNPGSLSSGGRHQYYGSLPPQHSRGHRDDAGSAFQQHPQQQQHQQQHHRHHQQQPRYQIPEEDECPVCHLELPKRTLDNWETLREQHIEECISLHSQYMMGNNSGGGGGRTRATSTATASSGTSAQPTPARNNHNQYSSNSVSGSDGTSSSVDSTGSSGSGSAAAYSPSSPRAAMTVHRHTGVFPYKATAKDCAADAECTICLEDLEVGDAMARLECFCRFHEQCIRAWFVRHPGRCPVHQHGMAD